MSCSRMGLKHIYFLIALHCYGVLGQQSCDINNLEPPLRYAFTGCQYTGSSLNNGCEISLSCETGFMPTSPMPLMTSGGIQKIHCSNGKWLSMSNAEVRVMQCVEGCLRRNYTTEIVNSESMYSYFDPDTEKSYSAVCRSTVVTKIEDIVKNNPGISHYYCPISPEDGKVNSGGCENICTMTYSIPRGSKIIKHFIELSPDMFMYTFGGMEMIVGCEEGYAYDPSNLYASYGQQVIECDGITAKLMDKVTGTEAVIAQCVPQQSCPEFIPSADSVLTSESTECSSRNGLVPSGCIRSYECSKGYYPSSMEYLYNRTQRVRCQNGTWYDQRNATITCPLTCTAGCVNLNYDSIVKYLQSNSHQITYDEFDSGDGKKFHCLTSKSRTDITQFIEKIQKEENHYFCRNTELNNKTYIVIEMECLNTCQALQITNLPPGVELIKSPKSFEVFGSSLIAGHSSYDFQCQSGYQYINIDLRNFGKQRFTCLGNNSYTELFSQSAFEAQNIEFSQCQKVSSCSLSDITKEENVIIVNQTCVGSGDINCEVTLTCAPGFYPTLTQFQTTRSIRKTCNINSVGVAQWIEVVSGSPDPYQCVEGCIERPSETQVIIHNGTEIVCSLTSSGNGNPFYCNSGNSTNDYKCTRTCYPLGIAENLSKKNLYSTLILDRFVAEGDGYIVSCQNQYVFRETKTNSKEYRCNGKNNYIDVSTNTVTNYATDTCILETTNTCSGNLPVIDNYTSRKLSCVKDANNRFAPGCLVEIECLHGSYFSSKSTETVRNYVCQENGLFMNVATKAEISVINDQCRMFDNPTTNPTPTIPTTTSKFCFFLYFIIYVHCSSFHVLCSVSLIYSEKNLLIINKKLNRNV